MLEIACDSGGNFEGMEVLIEIPVIEVDDASCETGNHREISKAIDRHYPCRIDISDGEFD